MKNLLIALCMLLVVTSCSPSKKDKDPEPELAGTYQVSRLIDESQPVDYTLPSSGISAAIIVSRPGDNQLSFRIDVTKNGRVTTGTSVTTTIRKASGKEYDIIDDNVRIGSINGTDFLLDFMDGGDRFTITARK